jgi:hypothetical protein
MDSVRDSLRAGFWLGGSLLGDSLGAQLWLGALLGESLRARLTATVEGNVDGLVVEGEATAVGWDEASAIFAVIAQETKAMTRKAQVMPCQSVTLVVARMVQNKATTALTVIHERAIACLPVISMVAVTVPKNAETTVAVTQRE